MNNDSSLTDLNGLNNITTINGSLNINNNALLANLDGLNSLTSVGSDLQISGNSQLTGFCGLFPLLSGDGLSGTYSVSGNSINPTKQDIIDGGACATLPVKDVLFSTPEKFVLEQNYPNPFNPGTTIKYSIAKDSFVTIKIYNTLGEEVATPVNEQKSAGNYEMNFNAPNLPSGIYIYKMRTNNFTSSKKMLLLK